MRTRQKVSSLFGTTCQSSLPLFPRQPLLAFSIQESIPEGRRAKKLGPGHCREWAQATQKPR